MKKILFLVTSLLSCILFVIFALASNDVSDLYKTLAVNFLGNITTNKIDLSSEKIGKNLYGEDEVIIYDINSTGYNIVNLKEYSIPELSLESENPFKNVEFPIYNGTLQYFYEDCGTIKDVYSGIELIQSSVINYYCKTKTNFSSINLNAKSPIVERYITGSLKTWYISGGNCGSIAAAICMRYYYDYVDSNYVPSGYTSSNNLISLMQTYVGVGGTTYNDMVSGLNSYFYNYGLTNSSTSNIPFSFSDVKASIISSRPIIVGTLNHPVYSNHWVIAHGYLESKVDGNYLIINNGWGSNNVWIEPNSLTLDGTINFAN